MAPVPQELSAPGTATYSSDTMTVGDGTWDFTKNTFLLPNLVGPNYDTMRYNGMGNRFSTVSQYHKIVIAHGVLAALAFLFLVPAGVFYARFYTRRPDRIIKHHARCQLVAGILLLAVFILGFFAVGPSRALTNPHHGIGVAIFVLFVLQLVGGWFIKHITKSRSLRIKIHQWFGRTTAILGIIQIPLGLTLYGSPLALFILFAVWMAILVLAYFILDHRREGRMDRTVIRDHHHHSLRDSRASRVTDSAFITDVTEKSEAPQPRHEGKSVPKWLLPLGIGAGLWSIMKGRKNRDQESGTSYTRSSRSRSRHRPEAPSRRGSMYESEYTDRTDRTDRTGRTYRTDTTSDWTDHTPAPRGDEKKSGGSGGIGKLMLGVGAALGGGKLFSSWMDRREDKKRDQAYSEVSTATPVAPRRSRPPRTIDTISEVTTTESSALSPVGDRTALASAYTAAAAPRRDASRPRNASRPRTPQRSHARPDRPESRDSWEESAFTESPSRRVEREREREASNKKGLLAMFGMGWLAKKMAAKPKEPEHRRGDSRYDDGYSDYDDYRSAARTQLTEPYTEASTVPPMSPPSRRRARRYSTSQTTQSALTATPANRAYRPPPLSGPPPPLHRTQDSVSGITDSTVEQQQRSLYSGPPMPPLNPDMMPPPNQGQMPPYMPPGQPTYAQGQPPYTQGQPPYNQGQPPYNQGQPPYNQGQPPYNQGQPPYNQGQPPYNQGQPPYNQGQPPYNPEQPPYNQGQPPYNPGQPPYSPPGQMPPPPLQTNFGYPNHQRSDSRTRQDPEHVSMPHIPPDPHGFLYDDESVPTSPSRTTAADRRRTRRRRAGTGGAPAATPAAVVPAVVPTPSALAADEEDLRRESVERPVTASTPTKPSFPVRFNDDHDRNVTIRRMTDEEMSRNRSSSMSSSDDTETPSARRGYRRDTRVRHAEDAPSRVTADPSLVTPTPSTVQGAAPPPPIAPLRRNQTAPNNKDSAYYSGPGQAAAPPAGLHAAGGTTVSSLVTAESHQESSAMGSAADRRSRRRQERRRADDSSASRTVDPNDMFN